MKKLRLKNSIIIIASFLITNAFSGAMASNEHDFPFYSGERMTFHVTWAFIKAGEAVLEVLPTENLDGVNSYHFVFTARTSEFVDIFYKVRDKIDSYTDRNMTHSLLYKKISRGKSQKEATVAFNWEKQQAQYISLDEKKEPISIMPGTFDPLSVFYAFRLYDPSTQKEFSVPLTDGKKIIIGKAKVIKRESVKVAGRYYDTFLVEPELERIGGVFEKSSDSKLQIWITADHMRIPVMIKSKVKVGSFVAELVSFERGYATSPTVQRDGS